MTVLILSVAVTRGEDDDHSPRRDFARPVRVASLTERRVDRVRENRRRWKHPAEPPTVEVYVDPLRKSQR